MGVVRTAAEWAGEKDIRRWFDRCFGMKARKTYPGKATSENAVPKIMNVFRYVMSPELDTGVR